MSTKDDGIPTEPRAFFKVAGRYLLSPSIAAGGMATVHIARPISAEGFARTVAIKRMLPHLVADEELATMFRDEARVCMRIRHPNVIPVIDVVDEAGELLLVMEYVEGESLVQLISQAHAHKRTLPVRIVSSILSGALHGLHAAHRTTGPDGQLLDIVHRDVSPHNVMVGIDGIARMTDFGVAKAKGRLRTTQDGVVRGKLAYMAPEQVRGEDVTVQSDLYGAGVVLWESLTGRALFAAEQEAAVVYKVLEAEVPLLAGLVPEATDALQAVVSRALAKNARDRFESAAEMARALEQAVPPASQSEVAAEVAELVEGRLEQRRELLAAVERETDAVAKRGSLASVPGLSPVATPHPAAPLPASGGSFSQAAAPMAPAPAFSPRAEAKLKKSPVILPEPRKKGWIGPFLFLVLLLGGIAWAIQNWEKVAPVAENPATAGMEIMCGLDDGAACVELGRTYELGNDVAMDLDRTRGLYQRACDLGHTDGCVVLARFVVETAEHKEEPSVVGEQQALLRRACDADNQTGCGALGRLLLGSAKKEERKQAAELLDKSCQLYDYESCATLGMALVEGKKLDRDVPRARSLCQTACERANVAGCSCMHHVKKAEGGD